MATILAFIYIGALGFIFFYSLAQLHLALLYMKGRKKIALKTEPASNTINETVPFVTVQLPVFNEMYVVERLIEASAKIRWPKDRFEIQVLDDSTDETTEIAIRKISEIKKQGISIKLVRRPNREGFKAGALKYGMNLAKGNFFAIFDADFLPPEDFLEKTMPFFADEKTGVVQTRWEHLNEKYSLLTRLQAFGLDGHFTTEQGGRHEGGFFLNFNGTSGVWRKSAIEEAGGWQPDTLTEDLDLSYRAQLKGWKIQFLESVSSPAELPAAMSALKSQQFRWTKGAAENARKNFLNVLRAKIPLVKKIHGLFHLANSFVFVCLLLAGIASLPLLLLKGGDTGVDKLLTLGIALSAGTLFLSVFYGAAWAGRGKMKGIAGFLRFIFTFPLFLCFSMGLSLHNAIATLEGYAKIKSAFIRTPKFNLRIKSDNWKNKNYNLSGINFLSVLEVILAFSFLGGILYALRIGDFDLLPFHILLCFGFASVAYYSIRQAIVKS